MIETRREIALLFLLATLWGAAYSFIKIGVATIPPITLIAARTLIAGAILLLILRARGVALPRSPAIWRGFALQACLNSAVPFTLIAWAEQSIDSGLAVILNSMTPVFAFLLTALLTRHEPAPVHKLIGVLLGLLGTVLIIGFDAFRGESRLLPELAVLAASLCYASAAIYGKTFRGLDPMLPAAGSLLCGTLLLAPLCLLVDRPWTLRPSAESLLALIALSAFSTALAFVIYFRLVRTLGSVGTTAQAYLRVPIGVAIGVVFLGDQLAATTWIGLVLLMGGVILMTLSPSSPAVPEYFQQKYIRFRDSKMRNIE